MHNIKAKKKIFRYFVDMFERKSENNETKKYISSFASKHTETTATVFANFSLILITVKFIFRKKKKKIYQKSFACVSFHFLLDFFFSCYIYLLFEFYLLTGIFIEKCLAIKWTVKALQLNFRTQIFLLKFLLSLFSCFGILFSSSISLYFCFIQFICITFLLFFFGYCYLLLCFDLKCVSVLSLPSSQSGNFSMKRQGAFSLYTFHSLFFTIHQSIWLFLHILKRLLTLKWMSYTFQSSIIHVT